MNLIRTSLFAPRARRDRLLLAVLALLVLGGLAGLVQSTGWQDIAAQIERVTAAQVAVLLILSLGNYLLRALRWHVFARRLGLSTTLRQNVLHFVGGFAMSVTPGRVGELVRMRWLRRATGWRFERTAPLALIDRASDLAAMGVLLAIALSLSAKGIAGGAAVTLLALIAAGIATRPRLLSGLADGAFRITGRWPRLFVRLRRAARSLSRFSGPGVIGVATLLGLAGWLAEGVAFHLLLVWMGHDIGIAIAIAIFLFATLAGGLTGAPGGLGGAEAAMIALLSLEGVPLAVSVPATAIIRLTTLWFAIGLGALAFPLAEHQSRKDADALEIR